MSLYSDVEALPVGTIFQVRYQGEDANGIPWMRTKGGVVDLHPGVLMNIRWSNGDVIPEAWQHPSYDQYTVHPIYTPSTN